MNRNLILVFVLLVTLSVVNAASLPQHHNGKTKFNPHNHKEKTKFGACPLKNATQPPTFDVTINPDPLRPGQTALFIATGRIPSEITKDTVLVVEFIGKYGNRIGKPFNKPACEKKGCTIKANKKFTINANNVPVPKDVTNPYGIVVALVNPSNYVLACAFAVSTDDINPIDSDSVPDSHFDFSI